MSPRFEDLKKRYEVNFVTKEQLQKYVVIGEKRPELGIIAEEYKLITGEGYTTVK